jgi:cupin 2 domain-containing protein
MEVNNLFDKVSIISKDEYIENILVTNNFKVERIISRGHKSPDNFWYDQDCDEFVLLLKGNAELEFQEEKCISLKPGDYLLIPAYKKHRVSWTSDAEDTIWLTIHFSERKLL